MRLIWKLWLQATTEGEALKLCDRFIERLGKDAFEKRAEPFPLTGDFLGCFVTTLENRRWNDAVVETMALGRRVGSGWIVSGNVEADLEGWSNRPVGLRVLSVLNGFS